MFTYENGRVRETPSCERRAGGLDVDDNGTLMRLKHPTPNAANALSNPTNLLQTLHARFSPEIIILDDDCDDDDTRHIRTTQA